MGEVVAEVLSSVALPRRRSTTALARTFNTTQGGNFPSSNKAVPQEHMLQGVRVDRPWHMPSKLSKNAPVTMLTAAITKKHVPKVRAVNPGGVLPSDRNPIRTFPWQETVNQIQKRVSHVAANTAQATQNASPTGLPSAKRRCARRTRCWPEFGPIVVKLPLPGIQRGSFNAFGLPSLSKRRYVTHIFQPTMAF